METSAPSVENVCSLLVRSRLLAAPEVQSLHRRWRLEAKSDAEDADRFAQWLVAHEYVTEYQASSLLRGQVEHFFLGHYKLLTRIGKGRMAGVYKAVHNLGYTVAIKVLPPSKARNPIIHARFMRESRLALRLQHPNVVRTFQMGRTGAINFIVMELLEGETLEDVLVRRRKLPVVESVRLAYQTLSGLQHIHDQGMVHRDLKPANLMLVQCSMMEDSDTTLPYLLKILDIGLGRDIFDDRNDTDAERFQLTSEGAVLGTPDYLAPEQARDAHCVDIRADIYSVGCILYRMLTGQPPFADKNVLHQIIRHATEEPRPIRELEPSVPEGLHHIVMRMIAKDPNHRFATPERAAQALQGFLAGQNPLAPIAQPPQLDSFLHWVETNGPEADASDAVEVAAPPARAPAYALQPESVAPGPLPSLPLPAAAVPTKQMHVSETAIAPTTVATAPTRLGSSLERRDYFLLAIGIWMGAAGVLLIEGILWLILQSGR